MIKTQVTIKGELEQYVKEQMERTGESAGSTIRQLADFGMEFRRGLSTFAIMADEAKKLKSKT